MRTTMLWMDLLGSLARPAFAWNRYLVMRQGGRGLAERLGASLIVQD